MEDTQGKRRDSKRQLGSFWRIFRQMNAFRKVSPYMIFPVLTAQNNVKAAHFGVACPEVPQSYFGIPRCGTHSVHFMWSFISVICMCRIPLK